MITADYLDSAIRVVAAGKKLLAILSDENFAPVGYEVSNPMDGLSPSERKRAIRWARIAREGRKR